MPSSLALDTSAWARYAISEFGVLLDVKIDDGSGVMMR
jgi:hypothetical protein